MLVVLLLAKALGYAISLGCGFRGGPVFPAIFLGVAVATFADAWFGVSPTLAIAVGTAAGMTATTRLILTPIVFAALLVGHNGVDTVRRRCSPRRRHGSQRRRSRSRAAPVRER